MLADRIGQLLRGVQTRPAERTVGAAAPAGRPTPQTDAPDFSQALLRLAKAQQEAIQQGDMSQFRALATERAQLSTRLHQKSSVAGGPGVDAQLQTELQRLDQMTRQMLVRRYAAPQPPSRDPGRSA